MERKYRVNNYKCKYLRQLFTFAFSQNTSRNQVSTRTNPTAQSKLYFIPTCFTPFVIINNISLTRQVKPSVFWVFFIFKNFWDGFGQFYTPSTSLSHLWRFESEWKSWPLNIFDLELTSCTGFRFGNAMHPADWFRERERRVVESERRREAVKAAHGKCGENECKWTRTNTVRNLFIISLLR